MRRVGKGFFGVDTSLFDGMLVPQQDKIAQAIEITKLKQRVRRGEIAELDANDDNTLETVDVQGRLPESQAQVYHLDLEHAQKVLSMQETDEAEPAEASSCSICACLLRGLGSYTRIPLPLSLDLTFDCTISDVVAASSGSCMITPILLLGALALGTGAIVMVVAVIVVVAAVVVAAVVTTFVINLAAVTTLITSSTSARKNMMVYLKNMAGFKMDFFKGMTYIEIRPIFENHFNSIWAFLEKGENEIEEEDSKESKRKSENLEQKAAKKQKIDEETEELKTHLRIVSNDEDDVYTEATHLVLKVPVVDYQIHTEHNKHYYKIIRADGTHQLFLSFISLLRNFNREDLEMLWKIVQERFEFFRAKELLR
nr:hypothetical protein [Tanacetum cinerariifolium]